MMEYKIWTLRIAYLRIEVLIATFVDLDDYSLLLYCPNQVICLICLSSETLSCEMFLVTSDKVILISLPLAVEHSDNIVT